MPDAHTLTVETSTLRSHPPAVRAVGTCSCLSWSMTAKGPNDDDAKAAVREAWEPHYQRATQTQASDQPERGSEAIALACERLALHPQISQLSHATGLALRDLLQSQQWAAKLTEQATGPLLKLSGGQHQYSGAIDAAVRLAREVLRGTPGG